MGKILVVAEKPSVGRDIARVLKCGTKGEGCLIGENYIVSWAIGHLVTLCEPEDYGSQFKKWSFGTLPILPEKMKLKANKQTASQLKVLKNLMNDAEIEKIICATDSGREGELIFRYIYDIVKCKKPFQRLWISSMTDTAIKEGFKKLKDGKEYDNLYFSAKCRSEADWLVGMNATRAYTLKYNALLSIGRVQTPTLAILALRQKEINAFVPKDYFEVQSDYGNFTGIWFDKQSNETKLYEKEKADQIAKKVKGQKGIVLQITKEEKKQPSPNLYDLTELQRDCNRKFGFSAQKTLSVAQSLYETKKMITYPRTDSRYLSDDMIPKIQSTLKKLSGLEEYKPFADTILVKDKLPLSKRIIDNSKVTDHHAIIPTDGSIRIEGLSVDEKKVYHTIVLRFLSVFYPNYIYSITKIITEILEERFLSKGSIVLDWGWMEIYQKLEANIENKSQKDKEEQNLPKLLEKDEVLAINTQVLKKKTQAPKPYNEATLLSAMENAGRFIEDEELREQLKDAGLGTPATRAAIIERLISVGYVQRNKKALVPTEKGMKLIEIVPDELKSPQTTGKWERGLSSIAKGNMEEEKFMSSIKRYVHFLIGASSNVNKEVVFEEETKKYKSKAANFGGCPLCKEGKILENTKAFYCNRWKEGCKFTIWKNSLDSYGNTVDGVKVKKLLKDKKLEGISVTKSQTQEKCTATLILKSDLSGALELMNMTRLSEE